MDYPINLPGFEGQTIVVKSAGMWKGPQLLVNGQPAPKGAKRGEMMLQANNGSAVVAKWKPQLFDMPQLSVGAQTIKVIEPLKWYQWVWGGLPVALVFIGGALGALVGILAFGINSSLFRSNQSPIMKYVLTGLVSVVTIAIYVVLVTVLLSAVNR